ncbi:6675_t:CDS:2 [Cetraspora pellucida]|uniref:6675_t:CDS:1 n=1 Tax=Cetraspora pellucida TaxID=1433469 RepID=A0ACA9MCW4_9GLOM|nr:6675_t:CDS:2 [Cetraspora pellucida]
MAGISFEVIENSFIKDMFKEFLPAYNTSSRTTLSGKLLDEEIACVNNAIDNDIDKTDYLTLEKGLKDSGFRKVALMSLKLWQNLEHTQLEGEELGSYKNSPQHLAELAYRIFSINPIQLSYERNFLMLKWILEDQADLQYACNISSVGNIMNYEEDQISVNNEISLDNITSNYSMTLLIEDIIDLRIEENSESSSVRTAQDVLPNDLDYDPCDMLDHFLEHKKQND